MNLNKDNFELPDYHNQSIDQAHGNTIYDRKNMIHRMFFKNYLLNLEMKI